MEKKKDLLLLAFIIAIIIGIIAGIKIERKENKENETHTIVYKMDEIAVKVGDFYIITPYQVSNFDFILMPDDLRYPNMTGHDSITDPDGHIYIDPYCKYEFTNNEDEDICITTCIANYTDEVQVIENCKSYYNYINFRRTDRGKIELPELGISITPKTTIIDASKWPEPDEIQYENNGSSYIYKFNHGNGELYISFHNSRFKSLSIIGDIDKDKSNFKTVKE